MMALGRKHEAFQRLNKKMPLLPAIKDGQFRGRAPRHAYSVSHRKTTGFIPAANPNSILQA